jgi:hypothetical protein
LDEVTLKLEGDITGPQKFTIDPDVIHWKGWDSNEKTLTAKKTVLFTKPGAYMLNYLVTCRSLANHNGQVDGVDAYPLHVQTPFVVTGKEVAEGAFHVVSMTANPSTARIGEPIKLTIRYQPGTFSGEKFNVSEFSNVALNDANEVGQSAERRFEHGFEGIQESTYQVMLGCAGVYKWTLQLDAEHRAHKFAGPVTITVTKTSAPKALAQVGKSVGIGTTSKIPTWTGGYLSWPWAATTGKPDDYNTGAITWSELPKVLRPGDTVHLSLALAGHPLDMGREISMTCYCEGYNFAPDEKRSGSFSFDGWSPNTPKSGEMNYTIPKNATSFGYHIHFGGNSGDGVDYRYQLQDAEFKNTMVDLTPK